MKNKGMSPTLRNFWKNGRIAVFLGGAANRAKKSFRPVAQIMMVAALSAALSGCVTTDSNSNIGKGQISKGNKIERLEPLKIPPPLDIKTYPDYSQNQKNQWYDDAFRAAYTHRTEFSDFIASMQVRLGDIDPEHKIIILDPDIIFASTGMAASASGKRSSAVGHLNSFFQARGRILMYPRALRGIAKRLSSRSGMMHEADMENGFVHERSRSHNVCVVYPKNPDSSALRDVATIAGLHPSALKQIGNIPGKVDITKDMMRRWVIYHEVGHCMGEKYLDDMHEGAGKGMPYIHARHQSESFGDVFSAFMMAADGDVDFAEKMARMRLIQVAAKAERLIRTCAPAGKIKRAMHSWRPAMYHTEPSINAAIKEIKRLGPEGIRKLGPVGMSELAFEIVEKNSLAPADMGALRGYQISGQKMIDHLEKRAAAGNSRDAERLRKLRGTIERGKIALAESVYDDRIMRPNYDAVTDEKPILREWTKRMHNAYLRGGTFDAVATEMSVMRDEIRQDIYKEGPDSEYKSVMLLDFLNRALTVDGMLFDVFHGEYKAGDKAKARWKIIESAKPQPEVKECAPKVKGELPTDIDDVLDGDTDDVRMQNSVSKAAYGYNTALRTPSLAR